MEVQRAEVTFLEKLKQEVLTGGDEIQVTSHLEEYAVHDFKKKKQIHVFGSP